MNQPFESSRLLRLVGTNPKGFWLLAGAALIVLTLLVYWPGLHSGFIFDDYANLPALGSFGPVEDFPGLLRYLTSGIADPTGRPLAMLSFLLDANTWPADPWPFKRTNLCIHLINGGLLFQVTRRLSVAVGVDAARARRAALLSATLWAVHPLWVSTVLYVVQRQAMLATLFVLLGIWVWLASQAAFAGNRPRRGWVLAVVSVVGCGLLAGLCKPNGLLLPLLLLVLQATVLHRPGTATAPARRPQELWLLLLPGMAIIVALLVMAAHSDPELRPWSVWQRLLTQPRVLFEYLRFLLLPSAHSNGLFGDAYAVSRSLIEPLSTLAAALGVLLIAALAVRLRRRWPVLAAAVLFFLAGHLFESTVLPLELYYEHRNYLPALLLFWPLALALDMPGPALLVRRLGAGALLLVFALLTLIRANLWAHPLEQALRWAADLPTSSRAQTHAAIQLMEAGRADLAVARLTPLLAQRPQDASLALTLLNARCQLHSVDTGILATTARALADRGLDLDVSHRWLVAALRSSRSAQCATLDSAQLLPLLEAVRAHARHSVEIDSRRARVEGYLALRERRCEPALAEFNRRVDLQRRPEAALEQSAFLASVCGPRVGLAHLQYYQSRAAEGDAPSSTPMLRLRDSLMRRQGYWEAEFARMEAQLRAEIADGK